MLAICHFRTRINVYVFIFIIIFFVLILINFIFTEAFRYNWCDYTFLSHIPYFFIQTRVFQIFRGGSSTLKTTLVDFHQTYSLEGGFEAFYRKSGYEKIIWCTIEVLHVNLLKISTLSFDLELTFKVVLQVSFNHKNL